MSATTMIHVRVDEQIKAQATRALAAMGLTVSDAVRVFLTRVVSEEQMPFALEAPNAEATQTAVSALALAGDLVGCFSGGPVDLSSNPRHLADFGRG